eukprot:3237874-Rhodomonas_salina.1
MVPYRDTSAIPGDNISMKAQADTCQGCRYHRDTRPERRRKQTRVRISGTTGIYYRSEGASGHVS